MEIPVEIAWGLFENFRLRKELVLEEIVRHPWWLRCSIFATVIKYADTWALKTIRSLSSYYHGHISLQYIEENCDVDMFKGGQVALKNYLFTRSLCDLYLPIVFPNNFNEPSWNANYDCERLLDRMLRNIAGYRVEGMEGLMKCWEVDVYLNYSDYEHLDVLLRERLTHSGRDLHEILEYYRRSKSWSHGIDYFPMYTRDMFATMTLTMSIGNDLIARDENTHIRYENYLGDALVSRIDIVTNSVVVPVEEQQEPPRQP